MLRGSTLIARALCADRSLNPYLRKAVSRYPSYYAVFSCPALSVNFQDGTCLYFGLLLFYYIEKFLSTTLKRVLRENNCHFHAGYV